MNNYKYAGFWFRVIATIIDYIIAIIFVCIVAAITGIILGFSMSVTSSSLEEIKITSNLLGFIVGILVPWLYFTLSESSAWQATLGKKMLGMKVIDMDGNRISFGKANIRYWSKIISAIIFYIGFIMVAFTERKQGLHDKIAGTLVTKDGLSLRSPSTVQV